MLSENQELLVRLVFNSILVAASHNGIAKGRFAAEDESEKQCFIQIFSSEWTSLAIDKTLMRKVTR